MESSEFAAGGARAVAGKARPVAEQAAPLAIETSAKGLRSGALSLFGSVTFGVASVAPAYSLAATIGLIASVVGLASPFVMLVAFIPMLMVSAGFNYMNRADPDCGQSFIWTARAMGPQVGWVVGFAAVAASTIVMANLVQIASQYMFLFFGLDGLASSTLWVTVGGVCWILFVAVFVAIGINVSAKVQYVLMGMQIGALALFTVWAIVKAIAIKPEGYAPLRLSHLFSTHLTASQLSAGVLLAIFLYWGWDSVTSVNEESKDSSRMPGISAILSTILLVVVYMTVTVAAQMYHGAQFLVDNPDDIFGPLAKDVLGSPLDKLVLLSVFTSGAASALTTLLPLTRSTLSMASHKAFPRVFGRVDPKYKTPFWGTVILMTISIAWYVLMTVINVNALYDAIGGLGFMICLTYGFVGFSSAIYYRKELFKSAKNFLLMGLVPAVGGVIMMLVFYKSAVDYWNPDNSYAGAWFGVGSTFVIGVGTILLGIVLMFVMWAARPEFFRRKPETWPGEGQPIPYADERVEG